MKIDTIVDSATEQLSGRLQDLKDALARPLGFIRSFGAGVLSSLENEQQTPTASEMLITTLEDIVVINKSNALSVHGSFDGLGHTIDFLRPVETIDAVRLFAFASHDAPIEAGRKVAYTVRADLRPSLEAPTSVKVIEYVVSESGEVEKFEKLRTKGKHPSNLHDQKWIGRAARKHNIKLAQAERAMQRKLGTTDVSDIELQVLNQFLASTAKNQKTLNCRS